MGRANEASDMAEQTIKGAHHIAANVAREVEQLLDGIVGLNGGIDSEVFFFARPPGLPGPVPSRWPLDPC